MTVRIQIYVIVLTLSAVVSSMLFGASAYFLHKQSEANLTNHLSSKVISFGSLLGTLDTERFAEPEVQQIISDEYRRILRRLTRGRHSIEFHLFNPDSTRVLWTTNTELAEEYRKAAFTKQEIFDTIAENDVYIAPLHRLLGTEEKTHFHVGAGVVTERAALNGPVVALLLCVIDNRPYLSFSSEFVTASIIIIFCATLLVVLIAEITTRVVRTQLSRLDKQIVQSIEQPGKGSFKPGLIAETNALGDALDTLDILLEDERARSRQSILTSRSVQSTSQVVELLKETSGGSKHTSYGSLHADFVPVGDQDFEWFAGDLETPAGICFLWGARDKSAQSIHGFADMRATRFLLLSYLEQHADDPFEAIKHMVDRAEERNIDHLGIALAPFGGTELHALIWRAGKDGAEGQVQQTSRSLTATIALAFRNAHAAFAESYIQEQTNQGQGAATGTLEAILKNEQSDVVAIFHLEKPVDSADSLPETDESNS